MAEFPLKLDIKSIRPGSKAISGTPRGILRGGGGGIGAPRGGGGGGGALAPPEGGGGGVLVSVPENALLTQVSV